MMHKPEEEAAKVFVGGLSDSTTQASLQSHFEKVGPVSSCTVMFNKASGKQRGFGFVTFESLQDAHNCLLKPHIIDGKEVDCKHAVPRLLHQPGSRVNMPGTLFRTNKIFVGGVSVTVDADKLKSYFSQFGTIADARISYDKLSKRHRGFGFVQFENEDAVDLVIRQYSTHTIDDKWIEVKRAHPRPPAGSGYEGDMMVRGGPQYGGGHSDYAPTSYRSAPTRYPGHHAAGQHHQDMMGSSSNSHNPYGGHHSAHQQPYGAHQSSRPQTPYYQSSGGGMSPGGGGGVYGSVRPHPYGGGMHGGPRGGGAGDMERSYSPRSSSSYMRTHRHARVDGGSLFPSTGGRTAAYKHQSNRSQDATTVTNVVHGSSSASSVIGLEHSSSRHHNSNHEGGGHHSSSKLDSGRSYGLSRGGGGYVEESGGADLDPRLRRCSPEQYRRPHESSGSRVTTTGGVYNTQLSSKEDTEVDASPYHKRRAAQRRTSSGSTPRPTAHSKQDLHTVPGRYAAVRPRDVLRGESQRRPTDIILRGGEVPLPGGPYHTLVHDHINSAGGMGHSTSSRYPSDVTAVSSSRAPYSYRTKRVTPHRSSYPDKGANSSVPVGAVLRGSSPVDQYHPAAIVSTSSDNRPASVQHNYGDGIARPQQHSASMRRHHSSSSHGPKQQSRPHSSAAPYYSPTMGQPRTSAPLRGGQHIPLSTVPVNGRVPVESADSSVHHSGAPRGSQFPPHLPRGSYSVKAIRDVVEYRINQAPNAAPTTGQRISGLFDRSAATPNGGSSSRRAAKLYNSDEQEYYSRLDSNMNQGDTSTTASSGKYYGYSPAHSNAALGSGLINPYSSHASGAAPQLQSPPHSAHIRSSSRKEGLPSSSALPQYSAGQSGGRRSNGIEVVDLRSVSRGFVRYDERSR